MNPHSSPGSTCSQSDGTNNSLATVEDLDLYKNLVREKLHGSLIRSKQLTNCLDLGVAWIRGFQKQQ